MCHTLKLVKGLSIGNHPHKSIRITTYHLLSDPQGAFKLDKIYSGTCFVEEFESGDI